MIKRLDTMLKMSNRVRAIFICFNGKLNFLFYMFITSLTSLFDILILALVSIYVLEKLSLKNAVENVEIISSSIQFYIDILSEHLITLIFIRFFLVFIRMLLEYYLRIKFIELIRNKMFLINSKWGVYSRITRSEVADFTSRISSWQLGANGLLNALTSIFSNISLLIIAPIWIFNITDTKMAVTIFVMFGFIGVSAALLKKYSLSSYKNAVRLDLEIADRLLYLFNDWRFLESMSKTEKMTGKASSLISNFARQIRSFYSAHTSPDGDYPNSCYICYFSVGDFRNWVGNRWELTSRINYFTAYPSY